MGLRINDVEVIPNEEGFDPKSVLEDYSKLPKPKPEYCAWLVSMGYVRIAPPPPPEKRKSRENS